MMFLIEVASMLLLSTWIASFFGLSVLILAKLANLIVNEFLN